MCSRDKYLRFPFPIVLFRSNRFRSEPDKRSGDWFPFLPALPTPPGVQPCSKGEINIQEISSLSSLFTCFVKFGFIRVRWNTRGFRLSTRCIRTGLSISIRAGLSTRCIRVWLSTRSIRAGLSTRCIRVRLRSFKVLHIYKTKINTRVHIIDDLCG